MCSMNVGITYVQKRKLLMEKKDRQEQDDEENDTKQYPAFHMHHNLSSKS